MDKKSKFSNIKKVKASAAMTEQSTTTEKKIKKKLINMPIEYENLIKESDFIGSVSAYILQAIQEKLKNDGLLLK